MLQRLLPGVGGVSLSHAGFLSARGWFSTTGADSSSSSGRLFVGGLSYDTNEPVLGDAFAKHGKIIEVKVICDRWTGDSKGFGFVQFATESEAASALQDMDGQVLEGRRIRVRYFASRSVGEGEVEESSTVRSKSGGSPKILESFT